MMNWYSQDVEQSMKPQTNPFKLFSKEYSTMLSNNFNLEEEDDLQKLLLDNVQKDNQVDFLSETNSLFDLQPETPFFFEQADVQPKGYEPIFVVKPKSIAQNQNNNHDLSSQKKKKKIKKVTQSCKCKHSNCLRLHCSCFKELGHCSPSCRCLNCLNTKEHKDAREFVINKTKTIYKKAFEEKHVIINGMKINKEGCNCSKNCENNYCGCKKVNGVCSPICRCSSCQNNKIQLSKEEIQKFYKPCSRKKDKIIINYSKEQQEDVVDKQKIVYKVYRKTNSTLQIILSKFT